MKEYLNKIRKTDINISIKRKIINSVLILLLGILLGILSKWLDNLSIDSSIWWHNLISILDLGNFFSGMSIWLFIALIISIYSISPLRASINVLLFFIGMTISYHLYTINFSRFNPQSYMIIWYTLTIITPFLAFICWYAKGEKIISLIISTLITTIMFKSCFAIGMWYIDLKSTLELIIFIATCIILYTKPKNNIITIIIALLFSFILKIPFIEG